MTIRRSVSIDSVYNPLEESEMLAVWQWAQLVPIVREHLRRIENGGTRSKRIVKTKNGLKTISPEGNRLRRAGLVSGTSDWLFFQSCGGYHILAIEQKRRLGSDRDVKPRQREFLQMVNKMGGRAIVAYGADQTIKIIKDYLLLDGIKC